MQLPRLSRQLAEVIEVVPETPTTKSLVLDVPGWEGHRAGQDVDERLTAEDGYQAQRSYSMAPAPEDRRLILTVERLEDGEVSPYLSDVLMTGDKLELRGPMGDYFIWEAKDGDPLLLLQPGRVQRGESGTPWAETQYVPTTGLPEALAANVLIPWELKMRVSRSTSSPRKATLHETG